MNLNEQEKKFHEEIDRRLSSSAWSESIAAGVLSAARSERKKKIFDITSILFPVAAAAALVLALTFQAGVQRTVTDDSGSLVQMSNVAGGDTSGIFNDEIDQIISYTGN
ncbi:MAG TPA: hypothetical protein PK544_05600 [Spirochaetota bacterium]|nr:hypothetical protein [Spirochaetota bacterium]HPJ38894.1 hypothetical protein [Spirochaetota bacterium]